MVFTQMILPDINLHFAIGLSNLYIMHEKRVESDTVIIPYKEINQ